MRFQELRRTGCKFLRNLMLAQCYIAAPLTRKCTAGSSLFIIIRSGSIQRDVDVQPSKLDLTLVRVDRGQTRASDG